jgi:hypothetical protein
MAGAAGLLAGLTLLLGVGWCFLMLMATSIGSKAQTALELFALTWPALGGGALAIAALWLRSRVPWFSIFVGLAGLVTMIGGVKLL